MNFFTYAESKDECFDALLTTEAVNIERIISTGQATPQGEWYEQNWDEWVLVIEGSAGLRLGTEKEIKTLKKGDSLFIPANLKHRVEWTDSAIPTLWLAVHFNKK